jgi:hypothetical protein
MEPKKPPEEKNPEGGNKVFLMAILGLSVLIIILLLLMSMGIVPISITGMAGGSLTACGDDNPCTTDYMDEFGNCVHDAIDGPNLACSGPAGICESKVCSEGSCVTEIIEDCCGNSICEDGETAGNCPIDCGGGISVNEETEGDNSHVEFDTGGEVSCNASAGMDGAFCICTEIDCEDGIDNDGDGLIDCDDPDCNCPVDCPECPPCDNDTDTDDDCEDECGDYPDCDGERCELDDGTIGYCYAGVDGCCHCEEMHEYDCESLPRACEMGTCPPGQRCETVFETDSSGFEMASGCECVEDNITTQGGSCQSAEAPACEGQCQDSSHCEYNRTSDSCECVWDDCEDLTNPDACTIGQCPPGEQCVETTWGDCTCAPIDCEDAEAPACEGDCPRDMTCEYNANDSCVCQLEEEEPTDCEDSENPACTGVCDSDDEECEPVGQGCECVSPENCGDGVDNDDDGLIDCMDPECCPPDYDQDGDSCCCENIYMDPNWESCYPDCDNCVCPDEGEECYALPDYPACECLEEEPTVSCEQSAMPACTGDCPRGQQCVAGLTSCMCVIPCESDDSRECTEGWCPEGEGCEKIDGECQCVIPCNTDAYPNCEQASCGDWGECIADTYYETCFCSGGAVLV